MPGRSKFGVPVRIHIIKGLNRDARNRARTWEIRLSYYYKAFESSSRETLPLLFRGQRVLIYHEPA